MQTLISAFDDRATARRAVERLLEAGFSREDVHLQEAPGTAEAAAGEVDPEDRALGERTMQTAEREVAVDRDVLTSIGHFFVSLFGKDHPARHAGTYSEAVRRGNSVVCVDARDDAQAEVAATVLHGLGAIDVDEHARQWRAAGWSAGPGDEGATPSQEPVSRPGVRVIQRDVQPPLGDMVERRSAQVSSNMEEGDSTERAARERDRAFAAGAAGEQPLTNRDPDAEGKSLTGTRKSDRDKPDY